MNYTIFLPIISFSFFTLFPIYSEQSSIHAFLDETNSKTTSATLAEFIPLSVSGFTMKASIYADKNASPEDRTMDLISKMNFEEKLAMTGGYNGFNITGVSRLGIRPVTMADASQGIRTNTITIKDKRI